MVTIPMEVAEQMDIQAKAENRTASNWVATAALAALKKIKWDQAICGSQLSTNNNMKSMKVDSLVF